MSSHNGIFFEIEIFVLKTFWTILNRFGPKKIRPKNFVFAFFRPVNLFIKKWLCQVIIGIFLQNRDFLLKYVLDHSESIPTKFFLIKIFCLSHFFWPVTPFFEKRLCQVITGNFFEIEIFFSKYVLDYPQSILTKKISTKDFCLCHFFDQKWLEIEVFGRFLVPKYFFRKFFCTSF